MLRITSIAQDYYPRPPQPIHASLLRPSALGTWHLTRLPRIQLCRRTSRRPPTRRVGRAGLPARDWHIAAGRLGGAGDAAWDCLVYML